MSDLLDTQLKPFFLTSNITSFMRAVAYYVAYQASQGSIDNFVDDVVAATGELPGFKLTDLECQKLHRTAMSFYDRFKAPVTFDFPDKQVTVDVAHLRQLVEDAFSDDDAPDDDNLTGSGFEFEAGPDGPPKTEPEVPLGINRPSNQQRLIQEIVVARGAEDLAKLNMKSVYAYLTASMSETARKMLDEILKLEQPDRVKVLWAANISKCAMMSGAMNDVELKAAQSVPKEEWQNPYEFYKGLSDTIVGRTLAAKTSILFVDPGDTGTQVAVCKIGAVINHTKHNVAFAVQENAFQLKTFIRVYMSEHPAIVQRVRRMMALLAPTPVHGIFMKYRPKLQYSKDDEKRVDVNRFTVTMRKHGSYPGDEIALKSVELQTLAMVSLASSPVSLFSLMSHTPGAKTVLPDFVLSAEKVLKPVPIRDVRLVYDLGERAVLRNFSVDGYELYNPRVLNKEFSAKMIESLIPTVAKDKGIYNNLKRVIQPFGCITLQIACTLCELEPLFAVKPWSVFSAADVALQLNLNVVCSDNLAAPSRSGICGPLLCAPPGGLISRSCTISSVNVKYTAPKIPTGGWLMDLAYDATRMEITDSKKHKRHLDKHRSSQMDYFGHDCHSVSYSSCNLFVMSKDMKATALWDGFVVVMPLANLTKMFCHHLMSVYDVTYCLGPPGMIFSVYLIGCKSAAPTNSPPELFAQWCTTAIFRRLQLYQKFYAGFPLDVDVVVEEQHRIIDKAMYVLNKKRSLSDDDFVAMFSREKGSVSSMAVINDYNPMADMTKLSSDPDAAFSFAEGVGWE